MKSIKFDDGYETFTINGDPERAIRFSARDANILLRYEKAMDEMKEECGRLSEGKKRMHLHWKNSISLFLTGLIIFLIQMCLEWPSGTNLR